MPEYKYIPNKQTGLQIKEFNSDEILSRVNGIPNSNNLQLFVVEDSSYYINLGNPRYHIFKENLKCVCCGIVANKCSLDKFDNGRHFNFYAETAWKDDIRHLILMTVDHILPKSMGGTDDLHNLQTMCFNCNSFKGHHNLSVKDMQNMLFSAYRAYKSSFSLRETQEKLDSLRRKIIHNKITIENIQKAFNIVSEEKLSALQKKIDLKQQESIDLQNAYNRIELDAQITGIIPEKIEYETRLV